MLKLKVSPKGEILIPKRIREKIGLIGNRFVLIEIKEKSVEIRALPKENIAKKWAEAAKKNKVDSSNLVYGDKLYEEVF